MIWLSGRGTSWRASKALIRRRAMQAVPWLRHRRIWVEGPLASWGQARANSRGYDDPDHLDRVDGATRAVLEGRAEYERDGVAFPEWSPEWPVMLAMARAATRAQRKIRVLDVGGALGGTYLRASRVLDSVVDCWVIVEQEAFVERSKSLDLPPAVTFSTSIHSGLSAGPDLVIFGSSLQYLDDPESALRQVAESSADTIALTRTPIAHIDRNTASVEHVPARFGQMSYPMWVLSRPTISSTLSRWRSLLDQPSLGGCMQTSGGLAFEWRDVLWTRAVLDGAGKE